MLLPRPAAGGESCKQDSFLPYRKVLRQKDIDYEVSKTLFYAQERTDEIVACATWAPRGE